MKNLFTLILITLISFFSLSQGVAVKTTISYGLDSNYNRVNIDSAFYIKSESTLFSIKSEIITRSDNKMIVKLITKDTLKDIKTIVNYYNSGKIRDSSIMIEEGYGVNRYEWFENGVLKLKRNQYLGKFLGEINTNWENGTKKRRDIYEDGKFISGKCFSKEGEEIKHFDFYISPSYKGGAEKMYQFIFSRIKYPQEAKENETQGKVYVGFNIETNGSVSDVRLLRGIGGGCDKEAMRVVGEMKNWNPGLLDGEPTPASYQLPINFRLR